MDTRAHVLDDDPPQPAPLENDAELSDDDLSVVTGGLAIGWVADPLDTEGA